MLAQSHSYKLTSALTSLMLFLTGTTMASEVSWITTEPNGCKAGVAGVQERILPTLKLTWEGKCDSEGKITGQGTATVYLDGKLASKCSGQYESGLANGLGTCQFNDGGKFSGKYIAGQRSGSGEMRWADGTSYKGDYRQGKREGFGELRRPRSAFTADSSSRFGQWEGETYVERGIFNDNRHLLQCSDIANCRTIMAKAEQQKYKRLACVTWDESYSLNPIFKNADIVKFAIEANMVEKADDQCEVRIRSQRRTTLLNGDPPYKNNEVIVIDCARLTPCQR